MCNKDSSCPTHVNMMHAPIAHERVPATPPGTCLLCRTANGGALSHICPVCTAEVCPECVARNQLAACPGCGETEQNWKALQKVSSVIVACSSARSWLLSVAGQKPPAADAKDVEALPHTLHVQRAACVPAAGNLVQPPPPVKVDLPPAVVDEVIDWLKEEVDGNWLDSAIEPLEEAQLELMDAGIKKTSVICANGDYRASAAREAVAYLLKSTQAAQKSKSKKGPPRSDTVTTEMSTAVPSAAGSEAPSAVPSQCHTQRSVDARSEAVPNTEEVPQTWRTQEAPQTWRTVFSAASASENVVASTMPATEQSDNVQPKILPPPATVQTGQATAPSLQLAEKVPASTDANTSDPWGLTALTRSLSGLASSFTLTAEKCSTVQMGSKVVVDDDAPEPLKPVVPESEERDDWADEHFANLENMAQGLTGRPEPEPMQVMHPPVPGPVVPPLSLPVTNEHNINQVHAQQDTLDSKAAQPVEFTQNDFPCASQVLETPSVTCESKEVPEPPTCIGIGSNDDGTMCARGHDLRWHAWSCSACGKRGGGLRFSCTECADANLCYGCKKNGANVATVLPTTAQIAAPPTALPQAPSAQAKSVVAVVPPVQLPKAPQAAPVKQVVAGESQLGAKAEPTSSSGSGPKRTSSSRQPRERPAGDRGSVLSVQSVSTSSAAQLLGPMAMKTGSKSDSSRRSRVGDDESKATSSVIDGAPEAVPREVKRIEDATKKVQSRSGSASAQPQRRRAGASVLSVKNASSSSAAGLLGPLLEQKAKH